MAAPSNVHISDENQPRCRKFIFAISEALPGGTPPWFVRMLLMDILLDCVTDEQFAAALAERVPPLGAAVEGD